MSSQWLLLRGLAREARHWGEFTHQFENELKTKVITLDLPGTGQSRHIPSKKSIVATVHWLRAQWQKVKGEGEASIFAVSLGAMITMEWLRLFPEDFTRAVVVNTSSKDSGKLWQRLKFDAFKFLLPVLTERDSRIREENVLRLVSNQKDINHAVLKSWAKLHEESPISTQTIIKQLWMASRYLSPEKLTVPIHFLISQQDRMVSPTCSEYLVDRLGATKSYHEWAGHDLPLDDPAWCLNEVKKFAQG